MFIPFHCPSRKNMEIFDVSSIRAGKVFDKTWKIQRARIEIFTKHPCNMQNFPKLQRILRKFIKNVTEF